MASDTTRTTQLQRLLRFGVVFGAVLSSVSVAFATEENDLEFQPPTPLSEYLPAAPGEPPVDFCSEWNPEFGFRGFRCCSNSAGRTVATTRGRRRKSSACAPNRIKWQFCDEMTASQREYVASVKAGKVDALEHIQKTMGSKGGQAFCGPSNGFLVEGRPLIPTDANRIEIRNEARCSNFGTDPMVGAIEWVGREIKKEYYEPEFSRARLIVGDIAAPRGGCISGRGGRRAHKSHTGGVDIDFAYFNPRAAQNPEERFTRTFYVASNWWMLKKLFKNPFACVKVVFLDKSHIRMLDRYAQTDPEWSKLKRFVRHVRGHRDHFHVRVGSGPGAPGCASDPNLEEDEDSGDEGEGMVASNSPESANEADDSDESDLMGPEDEKPAQRSVAALAATVLVPSSAEASGVEGSMLPAHKLEPAITAKYVEKKRRRTASHRAKKKRR